MDRPMLYSSGDEDHGSLMCREGVEMTCGYPVESLGSKSRLGHSQQAWAARKLSRTQLPIPAYDLGLSVPAHGIARQAQLKNEDLLV